MQQLESEKRARDPSYVPDEMRDQPDLMYSDEFVAAAYNPPASGSVFISWRAIGWTLVAFAAVSLTIWLCFLKDWKSHAHAV